MKVKKGEMHDFSRKVLNKLILVLFEKLRTGHLGHLRLRCLKMFKDVSR